MNWDVISAFAEILAAIAVVASLVYVGRQFRHSSTYALENVYFQTVHSFSSTAENASLIHRGNQDYLSLSDEEKFQYGSFQYNHVSIAELIYFQYKRGLANRETAERVMKTTYYYLSQPGFEFFWDTQLKHFLQAEFVSALESHELMGEVAKLPTEFPAPDANAPG